MVIYASWLLPVITLMGKTLVNDLFNFHVNGWYLGITPYTSAQFSGVTVHRRSRCDHV